MKTILLLLMTLLGVGAIFGGGVLTISPSGALIGMPLSMLDGSPFDTFLIPGIILLVVLGIAPLLLVFALIKRTDSPFAERFNLFADMYWPWSFTIYQAFALIIWIQIEMVFLNAVHWLHTFYMFYAVAMLVTALMPQIRLDYTKQTLKDAVPKH